jgi:hypothetical protein
VINPFTFDWDERLAAPERDSLLNKMADDIIGRGMQIPAAWIIEIHRPVMNIASQFGITLSPLLASLFPGGPAQMQKYIKLMQDRQNIDRLLILIDEKSGIDQLAAR